MCFKYYISKVSISSNELLIRNCQHTCARMHFSSIVEIQIQNSVLEVKMLVCERPKYLGPINEWMPYIHIYKQFIIADRYTMGNFKEAIQLMCNVGNLSKLNILCLASLAHKKFQLLMYLNSASKGTPHVSLDILNVKFSARWTSSLTQSNLWVQNSWNEHKQWR